MDKDKKYSVIEHVNSLLSGEAYFQLLLDVESALSQAEADVGMISRETADAISAKAFVSCVDIEEYPALYEQLMHPLVPLVKLLQRAVGPEHGQFVHYASTTGDILMTAHMKQLKLVWDIVRASLVRIEKDLAAMTLKYADTMMVGRTHNIHALPMTFGFKVAGWLAELRRNIERMDQAEERIFVIQMCGAIGTLASYGEHAFELQERLAARLDLGVPPEYCWQSSKDRYCEAVNIFALIAGLMGRISKQVYLLMMTEINELREGRLDTFVGSSAMPQKINPVNTQHMRGVERKIRYRATHLLEIMANLDHERNMDGSIDEQDVMQEVCVLMGEMMERSELLISTLTVDEAAMLKNLNLGNGVILSEAIMMELGKHVGRQDAHHIVSDCAIRAVLEDLNFRDLLVAHADVSKHLTEEEIDSLLDPSKYLGYSSLIAKEVAGKA